jgi:ribosome assembly protein RRB1
VRKVAHTGGINRVRSCPQQPHLVASWADTAQVQVWDLGGLAAELRDEPAPVAAAQGRLHKVNARHVHTHSSGGCRLAQGTGQGWRQWEGGGAQSQGRAGAAAWTAAVLGASAAFHPHAIVPCAPAEGYALDWSPVVAARLASGDCRSRIHVWEPTPGGKWAVSPAYR